MSDTAQSYFRDLVFFEEDVAWGTMGTVGYKLRVNNLAPRSEQGLITNMVYTGNRLPSTPFRDTLSCGLSFEAPLYVDECGWLLKHGVANPDTSGTGPYVHTGKVGFDAASVGDLPDGCSWEIGYTDLGTPLYHQFIGGRINEVVIPFGAGGPASLNCTVVCKSDDPDVTSRKDATPTAYTSDALSMTDISAMTEGGGASTIILGGEIRINNNLDTSVYCVNGGGSLGDLPTGQASVTGTLRVLFQDDTILDKVYEFTESSLGVTFTQGTASLALTVPELRYNRAAPAPGGGSGLIFDLSWEAYKGDHGDATTLKYVLTNSVASY